MASAPKSVVIRTYQVGFGDCFLLSFQYDRQVEKHVLIDFGSTGLPPGVPKTRLNDIARDIETRTAKKLHAVVATHRHQDHISGFATAKGGKGAGDIIRALKPDQVIQPWTEDPDLSPTATGPKGSAFRSEAAVAHIASLAAMHQVAAAALGEVSRRWQHFPKPLRDQINFMGEDNLSNLSAVKNLMTMAKNVYVHHGSKSGLERILPGVKIHVLGPPTLEQSDKIKAERRTDPDEFWQLQAKALAAAADAGQKKTPLFPRFVRSRGPDFPVDTRWLIYHARSTSGDQLLEIVRSLDKAMNNTSVILVFEVGKKKLLFPGDAQIENWQYALSQSGTKALLSTVNLYKVGHHGSLNATPKSLWNMFKNRSTDPKGKDRLTSIMSTMEGKFGKVGSGTEVPRSKLVSALKSQTNLFTTQELKAQDLFHETMLKL